MNRTKLSLFAVAATLLVSATLLLIPITPRVPVKSSTVTRGSLIETLDMTALVCDKGEQVAGAAVGGRVSHIYVQAGDAVQKGDRLFSLDDGQEQQALTALLGAISMQEQAFGDAADAYAPVAAVALQNKLELQAQAEALKTTILLKTVRAETDGVVRQLYIRKDELLPDKTAALLIGTDEKVLVATQRAQDMARVSVGMSGPARVDGEVVGLARVSGFSAPFYHEALYTYQQTLRMDVDAALTAGAQAQVELLISEKPGVLLAPLSAVSESGRIWVIRDGKAYAETADLTKRNSEWLVVRDELEGLSVVLAPDETRLKQGCAVKEQSR